MSSGRGHSVRTRGGRGHSVGIRGGRNTTSAPIGGVDSYESRGNTGNGGRGSSGNGGQDSSGNGGRGTVSAPPRHDNSSIEGEERLLTFGQDSTSLQVPHVESESRLHIQVEGKMFVDVQVAKKIPQIIKAKYDRLWTKYSEIPEEKYYRWAEEDEHNVWVAFKAKCASTIRSAFQDIRRGKSDGVWLGSAKLEMLKEKWKNDPEFLEASRRNKKNATTNKDGKVNRGGAISMTERVRRCERKLGRKVTIPEVFASMHCDEKIGKWITPESEIVYQKFKKMKEDSLSQGKDVDDSRLFYEVTGGTNGKGRSYGFGSESSKYASSSGSSINTSSRSTVQVEQVIDRLDRLENANALLEDKNARLEDTNAKFAAEIAELRSLILGKTNIGTPNESHSSAPSNDELVLGRDADEDDNTGF